MVDKHKRPNSGWAIFADKKIYADANSDVFLSAEIRLPKRVMRPIKVFSRETTPIKVHATPRNHETGVKSRGELS